MADKTKKRRGDRRDAWLVRDDDPMHVLTPYLFPDRCDNEAYISERIDLTAINEYIAKKNEGAQYPYSVFHIIAAALIKTVTLRPKLNRFIKNKRMYHRKDLTLAFVVKKQFNDDAQEGLAYLSFDGDTTIDSFHDRLMAEIHACRGEQLDNTSKYLEIIANLPKFVTNILMAIFHRMDNTGTIPYELVKNEPYHSSVFISNLGSIKLKSGYHHLTNWGTTSIFVVIGEKSVTPFFKSDGTYEMRESLEITMTLDERLADGYYYSKSVRLLKHLLQHPELLELPAKEEVEY